MSDAYNMVGLDAYEKTRETECCKRTQKKEDKDSVQVGGVFEISVSGDVAKTTPIGKALDLFGVNVFVRFKAGGAGAFKFITNYCLRPEEWGKNNEASGQVTGAGEVGLRFGNAKPGDMGAALEGYGGIEAFGTIKRSFPWEKRFLFDIETGLNFYAQVDVVHPTGSFTLVKRNFELTKKTTDDFGYLR